MKKQIVTLLICIFYILAFVSCGKNSKQKSELDLLEAEFNSKINNFTGSNAEECELIIDYSQKWKALMDKYYGLLSKKLSNERKAILETAQNSWKISAEKDRELKFAVYATIFKGGTIISIYSCRFEYEKYRERAIFLYKLNNDIEAFYEAN